MDLYQIQKNVLQKVKIDSRKVSAWAYSDQSIVFDFLLSDYLVNISYTVLGQTLNFTEHNKNKASKISSFPKFLKYVSEICGSYPQPVNQASAVLFFKFAEADWVKVEAKFSEILEVTSIYSDSRLCYILNVERDNGINPVEYLDEPEVEYIGVQGNSNELFPSYARNCDLNDYVYELNSKGLLVVEHKMGVSVFRRINKHSYKNLLAYPLDSFHELRNVTYIAEAPKALSTNKKNLLVLLSYINKDNENMVNRYYSHPFPFISNGIMPDIYIIRMADMSDTFGSHGSNTKFDENIEANTQNSIKSLTNTYNVDKEGVAICNASSGGTEAVYHDLIGGYKTFAIDPSLGNHKYHGGEDPLYLHSIRTPIGGIFKKLPDEADHNLENQVAISLAKVSEFYPDIKELKEALPIITLCEFDFEKIQEHLDFSGNTVFLSNTIISNLLLGTHIIDSDINLN